jgi:hypothetical protein
MGFAVEAGCPHSAKTLVISNPECSISGSSQLMDDSRLCD